MFDVGDDNDKEIEALRTQNAELSRQPRGLRCAQGYSLSRRGRGRGLIHTFFFLAMLQ
jgi:hypothetical protein